MFRGTPRVASTGGADIRIGCLVTGIVIDGSVGSKFNAGATPFGRCSSWIAS